MATKKKVTAAPATKKEKSELPKTITLAQRYEAQTDAHAFKVLPAGTKLHLNEDGKTYGNDVYGDLKIFAEQVKAEE